MSAPDFNAATTLNVNVGILGHVDSGKTSLARSLSTESSTAAFDKSPQSQQRGITLDLGFSAFRRPVPESLRESLGVSEIQFTLVDHPGHASLIRTIIGGSRIMDVMLLVVDSRRGVQAQTAEGIVVGTLATSRLVVALNKQDTLPVESAESASSRLEQGLRKVLEAKTSFRDVRFVRTCATSGVGVEELREALLQSVADGGVLRSRRELQGGPFVALVDHCFTVKGQGTVATGTVVSGEVRVGDSVECVSEETPVAVGTRCKSIQAFHRPVQRAAVGDRVGMLLQGLDSSVFERGVAARPGFVSMCRTLVSSEARRVEFFKGECVSLKTKFHLTVAHSTTMATVVFFRRPGQQPACAPQSMVDRGAEYELVETLDESCPSALAVVFLEQAIPCPLGSLFIASHMDADINKKDCRLAFHGMVCEGVPGAVRHESLPRIYRTRTKEGTVERLQDSRTAIGRGLFKKETSLSLYNGLTVTVLPPDGQQSSPIPARIDGSFGKSAKFHLSFASDVTAQDVVGRRILLSYKKFLWDAPNNNSSSSPSRLSQ